MRHREWGRRAGEKVWKWIARLAVLIVISSLPVLALAHTKLFYRMSCRSDYRKVEIVETAVTAELAEPTEEPAEEPTVTPFVEIPLESSLTPEPTLTPEVPEQITTPSDLITTPQDVV